MFTLQGLYTDEELKTRNPYSQIIEIWEFGERRFISSLQNAAIDALIRDGIMNTCVPNEVEIQNL